MDHADADMYRELYQRNQSLQKQLLEAKEVRRGSVLILNGSILHFRSVYNLSSCLNLQDNFLTILKVTCPSVILVETCVQGCCKKFSLVFSAPFLPKIKKPSIKQK